MESPNKTRCFLKGLIPIVVYFIALAIISVWWLSYAGTEMALTFGLFFYLPYELGGAFILCLIQGILVRKWSRANKIAPMLLYLVILVFCVYLIIWFQQSLLSSSPDLIHFYRAGVSLLYPLSKVDTPPTLLETAGGFLLGWLIRSRKERRLKTNCPKS